MNNNNNSRSLKISAISLTIEYSKWKLGTWKNCVCRDIEMKHQGSFWNKAMDFCLPKAIQSWAWISCQTVKCGGVCRSGKPGMIGEIYQVINIREKSGVMRNLKSFETWKNISAVHAINLSLKLVQSPMLQASRSIVNREIIFI